MSGLPDIFNLPPVNTDLSGKTVIIIGANTGLGLEAAKHFAKLNLKRLIVGCRSEEKCASTCSVIVKETGFDRVEGWPIELGSFESVIAFADRFASDGGHLDLLLNNAAVLMPRYEQTENGWETSIQVNHLSGALLAFLLLPHILRTAEETSSIGRIVFVTSSTHGWVDFSSGNVPSDGDLLRTLSSKEFCNTDAMRKRYPETKLLNVLFVREFNDHIRSTLPVVVTSVDPGLCATDLARNAPISQELKEKMKYARTAEEGSRQLIRASLLPLSGDREVDELSIDQFRGAYYSNNAIKPPSDWVRSDEGKKIQSKVWSETVAELSKVSAKVKEVVQEYGL
ncbi:NAD(P)-binding domain superfamily protein [Abortiporus biennis]